MTSDEARSENRTASGLIASTYYQVDFFVNRWKWAIFYGYQLGSTQCKLTVLDWSLGDSAVWKWVSIWHLADQPVRQFFAGVDPATAFETYPYWSAFTIADLCRILGSYTTFSVYAFLTIALISQGRWGLGIFYLIGSALLGAVFAILGLWLENGF